MSRRVFAAQALAVGAWVGGIVGILEVGLVALRRFALDHILYLGPQVVWMAPAADLILFATLGLASGAAALFLRADRRPAAVATLLATAAALALLLHLPWLDERAAIIVALGLGIQSGRIMASRWEPIARRATGWVAALAILLLLVSAGLRPFLDWQEARRLARLPDAPSRAPNILLLVLDTVRALNLGAYGYARSTSANLDSLAAHGVLYERAYATASWTLPSHGSFFTGRDAHELNADVLVPLDDRFPTLAERLRDLGFATAGFVANQRYVNPEWGLARGFTRFEVYPVTLAEIPLNASLTRRLLTSRKFRRLIGYYDIVNRKRAADVHREFLAWLERRPSRPFFAFLNYFDAHEPYLPPAPFDTIFGERRPTPSPLSEYHLREVALAPRERLRLAPGEQRRSADAYDGAIRYLDQEIGRLMRTLASRDLLNNTIVVITSDHGEHLGEAGRYLHGFDLYAPVLHVPLIVIFPPGVRSGGRVSTPVSLADLPVTIAQLAGLGREASFPGQPLAGLDPTQEPSPGRRALLSSFKTGCRGKPRFSIVTGRHQYIQDGACGEFLYDVVEDPFALRNLLGSAGSDSVAAELREVGTELTNVRH